MITPELIIFDCDGTLADSEYLNGWAVIELLHRFGLKQYTLEYADSHFVGRAMGEIVKTVEQDNNIQLPADFLTQYVDVVRANQDRLLKPVPHALDFVAQMSSKIPICVASNGERGNVLRSLSALGFMQYFTEAQVFTKIQVSRPKPYPDLFQFAAKTMGAKIPENILVFEDSVAGVKAGVAAGMTVYGYAGVSHNPEKISPLLLENGAKKVIFSYQDIKTSVENQVIIIN